MNYDEFKKWMKEERAVPTLDGQGKPMTGQIVNGYLRLNRKKGGSSEIIVRNVFDDLSSNGFRNENLGWESSEYVEELYGTAR